VRGISVSTYLGKLVDAELKRRRATPLAATSGREPVPDTALDALATSAPRSTSSMTSRAA
jgi:hypothetical protein